MKRMVAGFALALALSGSAAFADGMVKTGTAYSAPTWSGFYVGAGVGGAAVVYEVDIFGGRDYGGEGFFGTVTLGYDHQINSRWVAGIFADYDFSNIKTNGPLGADGGSKNTWAIGGRLGVLTSPTTLWYGTAGYTQMEVDLNVPVNVPTFTGYFLGLGAESQVGRRVVDEERIRFSQFDGEAVTSMNSEPTVHSFRAVLSYKFGDRREEVRAPLK